MGRSTIYLENNWELIVALFILGFWTRNRHRFKYDRNAEVVWEKYICIFEITTTIITRLIQCRWNEIEGTYALKFKSLRRHDRIHVVVYLSFKNQEWRRRRRCLYENIWLFPPQLPAHPVVLQHPWSPSQRHLTPNRFFKISPWLYSALFEISFSSEALLVSPFEDFTPPGPVIGILCVLAEIKAAFSEIIDCAKCNTSF